MIQTKPFFGPEGLTSTSANHYCNIAKEVSRKYQNYLANVKFYSTDMNIIGEEGKNIVSKGISPDNLAKIKDQIGVLAQLNSLIAFFREAIKEKERVIQACQNYEHTVKLDPFNAEYEKLKSQRPKRREYITEDDVIRSWTIGEQEHYLSLEAEAAVLGKTVHEDGCLSKARIDMMQKDANPISVKENGRDTIIYSYTSTVSQDDVDEMYYALQAHHREVQAELNGMKKRIEDAIDADILEKDEEYRVALAEWSQKMSCMESVRTNILAEESVERKKLVAEASALKIVVPNRLKPILEELKKL